MRFLRYVVPILVLCFALLIPGQESMAQSTGVWVSAIQVQNLGDDTATVQIDFYNEDGSAAGTGISDTITAGASKLFYLPGYSTTEIPNGFRGAAVVHADQPVAAIVNQVTSTVCWTQGVPENRGRTPYRCHGS